MPVQVLYSGDAWLGFLQALPTRHLVSFYIKCGREAGEQVAGPACVGNNGTHSVLAPSPGMLPRAPLVCRRPGAPQRACTHPPPSLPHPPAGISPTLSSEAAQCNKAQYRS